MEIYGYKFDELSESDQRKVRETAKKLEQLYKSCRQRKPMMRAGAMPCDVSPDEPEKLKSVGTPAVERPELCGVSDCDAAQQRSRLLRSKLRSGRREESNGISFNLILEKDRVPMKVSHQPATEPGRSLDTTTVPCPLTNGKYHDLRALTMLTNLKIQTRTLMVLGKNRTADKSSKNELVTMYWKRSLIAFLTKDPTALRRNIELIKCLTGETAWDGGVRKLLADSLNRPMTTFPKSLNASKVPTLSYPAHGSIPNLINCLELKKCLKGPNELGFITTKRLKPGDVVLIEEACLWKISHPAQFELCDYCGAGAALALVPCMGCAQVFYCSDACYRAAVSEYHWFECKVFRNDRPSTSATLRLMLRIFAIGYTAYKKDWSALYQQFLRMTKRHINPLRVHNVNDRSPKARYDSLFAVPLPVTIKKLYDNNRLITEEVNQLGDCLINPIQSSSRVGKGCSRAELNKLLKHYAIVLTRDMATTHIIQPITLGVDGDGDGDSDALQPYVRGTDGFYPLLSLFSMSCNPNIQMVCSASNRMTLLVNRPIAQGERLTIMGYTTFNTTNREQRQKAMQNHFKMVCECDACVYDYAQIHPPPDATLSTEDDLKQVADALCTMGATGPPYSSEFLWLQTLFREMLMHCYSLKLPGMIGYVDLEYWKDIDLLSELYDMKSRQEV